MIIFKRLKLLNFGTYFGETTISFREKGVHLIVGSTGKGKTTILHAFQYLFLDYVPLSGGKKAPYHELISYKEQECKVELDLLIDDTKCKIVKTIKKSKKSAEPKRECEVMKGSIPLGDSDRASFFETTIPANISQFFMCDSMDFEKYNQRIVGNASAGNAIKVAIEDLVGLPKIKQTSRIISHQQAEQQKKLNKLKKGKITDSQKKDELDRIESNISGFETQVKMLNERLKQSQTDKDNLQDEMTKNESLRVLLADQGNLKNQIDAIIADVDSTNEDIVKNSHTYLPFLISDWLKEKYDETLKTLLEMERHKESQTVDNNAYIISIIKKVIDSPNCDICTSSIDDDKRLKMKEHLAKIGSKSQNQDKPSEDDEFNVRRGDLSRLKTQIANHIKTADQAEEKYKTFIERLFTLNLNKKQKERALDKLNESLAGHNIENSNLNALGDRYIKAIAINEELQNSLRSAEKHLDDEKYQQRLLLNAQTKGQFKDQDRIYQIYSDLTVILQKSMTNLREKLSKSVQQDATNFFLKVTPDSRYTDLRIDPENYCLVPLNADGSPFSETLLNHGTILLVTYALYAALHRNSPIKGPLLLDSTFDVLASEIAKGLLEQIHTITDQVIILTKDLPCQNNGDIKKVLGQNLAQMYFIDRNEGGFSYIDEVEKLPEGEQKDALGKPITAFAGNWLKKEDINGLD